MASHTPTKSTKRPEVYIDAPRPTLAVKIDEKRSGHASLASKENKNPGPVMPAQTAERDKPTRKRKLSESNSSNSNPVDPAKKRKPSEEVETDNKEPKPDPSTYFYCHQCGKRRDLPLAIICSFQGKGDCRAKYCKPCLKNRYGLDLDAIKGAGIPDRTPTDGHTKALGYIWKCPRCCDNCNCKVCRKKQGLGPTGNLAFAARKQGVGSAAQMLAINPTAQGIMRGVKLPDEEKASFRSRKLPKIIVTDDGDVQVEEGGKKKARGALEKEQPEPEWEAIDPELDREEIEGRMGLRDFAIRFSSLLDLKLGVLEDLDEFDHLSDSACLVLMKGMVDILARESQDKAIINASRSLRTIGPIPTKIWALLDQAKSNCDPSSVLYDMPRPAEALVTTYNTRTGQSLTQAVQLLPVLLYFMEKTLATEIVHRAIEEGAEEGKQVSRDNSRAVKEENESWGERKKEYLEERTANEKNPNWKADEWKAKLKKEEKEHRAVVGSLEGAYYQLAPLYAPRFRHAGVDLDGRTYYILSPVNTKRKLREEDRTSFKKWAYFVSVWGKKGTVVKESPKDDDDSDEDSEDDVPEREQQWWGFHDVKEIRKLARYLQWRGDVRDATEGPVGYVRRRKEAGDGPAGEDSEMDLSGLRSKTVSRAPSPLSDVDISDVGDAAESAPPASEVADVIDIKDVDMGGPTSSMEMKSLVKKLNEFADWLEWRTEGKS